MGWAVVVWVIAAILLASFLLALAMLIRARRLSRWVGAFECAWRAPEDQAWVSGVGVYGVDRLDWYRLVSLVPTPARRWIRQSLVVSPRRRSLPGSPNDVVEVHCSYDGQEFFLALDDAALAGLTGWLEASPPRHANYEID